MRRAFLHLNVTPWRRQRPPTIADMFQPALTMNTVLACVDATSNFLQVNDEGEVHTGETRFSNLTGYDTGPTSVLVLR